MACVRIEFRSDLKRWCGWSATASHVAAPSHEMKFGMDDRTHLALAKLLRCVAGVCRKETAGGCAELPGLVLVWVEVEPNLHCPTFTINKMNSRGAAFRHSPWQLTSWAVGKAAPAKHGRRAPSSKFARNI